MTCQLTEKISAWIDGELTTSEALSLERHLNDCAQCREARADFLNLRSELVSLAPTVDQAAARLALANVLHRNRNQRIRRAGFNGLRDLIAALRFQTAFATVALMLMVTIVGLWFYRNTASNIPTNSAEGLISERNPRTAPSPIKSAPAVSPTPPDAQPAVDSKPSESQKPIQKSRPPVELPKVRRPADDVISPWRNQAIAANSATETKVDSDGPQSAEVWSLTARHLGQAELLLRSFRNVRAAGKELGAEVDYERGRAQKLVYQNILLRREAEAKGDIQVATLLESLEPILLDIANLPKRPLDEDVRAIKDRLQRKNLVALLQVNSTVLARANE
jgi:anti-sigma factor RsiW